MFAFPLALLVATPDARAEDRPFLFAQDGNTPTRLTADVLYRVTWGIGGGGAVRPIGAAGLGLAGSLSEIGGELGLHDRVSARLYALGEYNLADGQAYATFGGELRARLIGRLDGPFQLTLGLGALREFSGAVAFDGRIVATVNLGGLRATADVLFEHSFRPRADPVDVIVTGGVSYAIVPAFRLGVEYVGQDWEAETDPAEMEGPRHMVGPTLALNLSRQHLQFVGGPLFGLTPVSPTVMIRLGVVGTL
jgi:hypothetical protein